MVRINIKGAVMIRLLGLSFLAMGLLFAASSAAVAKIKVFACEPEWASLADAVGGAYVETYAATHANQDPHHIRARPSLIANMRGTDLVFCSGADLEVGWLPLLLQKAGSVDVQPGERFNLMAADYVSLLEKQEVADRRMGHVHPAGNPHVHLNPHNILLIAGALSERLQRLDPANAPALRKQYEDFAARWTAAITRWERDAAQLKGRRVITHHRSWSYLIDWLGFELVDTLEPKPGIPPTTGHLEALLQTVRNKPVLALIRTPYDPDDASEWLASKTGTAALELPYTVGGADSVTDLFSLYDQTLEKLNESANDQQ